MSDREEKIRERAYRLWVEEGQPEGRHDQHWEEARRQIDAEEKGANAKAASGEAKPKTRRAAAAAPAAAKSSAKTAAKPAAAKTTTVAKAAPAKPSPAKPAAKETPSATPDKTRVSRKKAS